MAKEIKYGAEARTALEELVIEKHLDVDGIYAILL